MILGAGTFQKALIQELKAVGLETHVVSNRPSDIAVMEADVFHAIDYTKMDQVWVLFKQIKAIQIVSSASDAALETEAFIRKKANLKGCSPEFITYFTDKWNYKSDLLQKQMTGIPQTTICKSYQDLLSFLKSYGNNGIIIKPRQGSGSKSVVHIHNKKELQQYEWEKKPADYLVEEYIEGQEYGGDFFVYQGEIAFYYPTLKSVNEHKVPISHLLLSPNEQTYQLSSFVQELTDKMHLQDGIYNVDIIIRNKQAYLIDLAPRIGGNCIPNLNLYSRGMNEWHCLSNWLIYNSISYSKKATHKPTGVFIIGSKHSGTVSKVNVKFPKPDQILDHLISVKVGDQVKSFTEGSAHLGYIIYTSNTDKELFKAREEIENFPWVQVEEITKVVETVG